MDNRYLKITQEDKDCDEETGYIANIRNLARISANKYLENPNMFVD